LAGALVEVNQIYISVSDSQGYYRITDLCPNKYQITCRVLGYHAMSSQINLSKNTAQDFAMLNESKELDPVVVSGIRNAKLISTLPESELTGKELDKTR